jgi:hypothetical protein
MGDCLIRVVYHEDLAREEPTKGVKCELRMCAASKTTTRVFGGNGSSRQNVLEKLFSFIFGRE